MTEPTTEVATGAQLAPWVTPEDVRDGWADAPMDDERLELLIAAAHVQVLEYAPELPAGTTPPANYLLAERLQTRALGGVAESSSDVEGFSPDGFAVRRRPLTADVKALLRPKRAVPRLG